MGVLFVASSLEVNTEQTKHVATPHKENEGQNHNIQICNKSPEKLQNFKYLGTMVTNQNYMHEEMTSRFNSGNVCFYSMQNLLSSSLLP